MAAKHDRPVRPATTICVYTRAWTSGAGRFAQELTGALLEQGAAVIFISPRVDRPAVAAQPGLTWLHPPRETALGPRWRRVARSLARIGGSALSLARARLATRDFIVSIPDPLWATLPLLVLLRLSGARIRFIAHDPVPHSWKLPPRWRRLELAAHGWSYRLSNTVVVLSEPSRTKLLDAYPRLSVPTAVIEHGEFALGEPAPVPGSGLLLAFGTIRRNKGTLAAIAGTIAARRAGLDVRLLVAGGAHWDEPDYPEECVALARTAPDAVEVRMAFVDDADLPGMIAGCDALLMPYADFHSQSGVALLAASNARPVIATAAGGIASLIAEGMPATPIADPAGPAEVAAAIAAFTQVPADEWTRRALAYRDVTMEQRSWRAVAARYLALCTAIG